MRGISNASIGRLQRAAVAVVIVFSVSAAAHTLQLFNADVHIDERDWSARAYFYRLAFMERDFGHKLWTEFDSIDQPHMTDFLIGASFHVLGHPVPEVPVRNVSWAGHPPPSGRRLLAARLPGVTLGALVPVLVYAIGLMASGRPSVGLVAGLFYAGHPLAFHCQPRAMSDAPLAFFSASALLLLVWSFPDLMTPREAKIGSPNRRSTFMIFCPVLLGLATATKLTGVFYSLAAIMSMLAAAAYRGYWVDRSERIYQPRYVCAFLAATAFWTMAFNPSLYTNPLRLLRMLGHRGRVAHEQSLVYPLDSVPDLASRFAALYVRVFRDHGGPILGWLMFATFVIGLGGACAREARRIRDGRPSSQLFPMLSWTFILVAGLAPTLPLNWDRYYLPFLPCAAVFVGLGVTEMARFCNAGSRAVITYHE